MSPKKHKTRFIAIIALVLIIGIAVLAQSAAAQKPDTNAPKGPTYYQMGPKRAGPGGPNSRWLIAGMKKNLALTDDQTTAIENIMTSDKDKMKTANQAVAQKRKALEGIVQSGADEQAIRTAAEELGKTIGNQAVLQAANVKEMKKILTADQFEKWQQMKENFREHRKNMFRKRPGQMGSKGMGMEYGPKPKGKGRRPASPETFFNRKDVNDDGKLSAEEFTKQRPQRRRAGITEEDFKAADTDSDGFLSLDEYKAVIEQFRPRRPRR